MTFLRSWMAPLALALCLAGCATDPTRIPLGTPRAEALQRLGTPTATYSIAGGGERLQYSRQPSGYAVDNVDLDAAGRVVGIRAELDDPLFDSPIELGKWREREVLFTYGKPSQIDRVTSFDGNIWSWRYLLHNTPRLFYVYFDPQGVVQRFHTGDDPQLLLRNR